MDKINALLSALLAKLTEKSRRERSEAAIRRLQEAARFGMPTLEQRNAIDDLEWLPRRMGGR